MAHVAVAALVTVAFLCGALSGPQVARAVVPVPAFPRLAAWWPDCGRQPIAQLAKRDWIALQNADADHIAELRAANPSIIVLGTTSGRELNYVLGDYNNSRNVELRSASTDWILTQVGSRLTSDITASTTSIPVADVTKFAVGEMVLVDHELLHVDAIGTASLTVSARPTVNPAAAHAVGARIAAVVSAWPGAITFDVSTNCAKADVGHGLETWNDWNARRGRAIIESADWDGLFVDCLESSPSWMVGGGDVRSIDPLRTNTPVTDGYAAFNAAWSSGAVAYGNELRAAVGSKILIGNGNMRNFNLNGNVFEDFPRADLAPSTWNLVFTGPWSFPHASYAEWCANTPAVNLTLIQTYGTATDYKLMRFGLTSALMNDGYFEMSGTSHAASGLYWFDEYDNAGAGRGYLGRPTGSAVQVGDAWRRDYDGGLAVVNPSDAAVTVQLGGPFRKINGTQAPGVNDGTTVLAVTVPGHDGVILLRTSVTQTAALQASRTTLTYGQETILHVEVPSAPEAAVRIEQRAAGSSLWQRAETTNTDAAGAAAVARTPRVTTEYRVVLVDSGAASRVVKVGVRPRVTLRASQTRVLRAHKLVFSGAVTHPGRVNVSLQVLVGHTWRTVKRLVSSTSGRYSVTVRFPRRGKYSYRAYVPADASHLTSLSGTVRIAVR